LKPNYEVRMGYLDFMKIVSRAFLLGSEKELSHVPSSSASMETASIGSSSMQAPDVLQRKRAPAKDPPFQVDGKTKDHVSLKLPAARTDSEKGKDIPVTGHGGP
jgi:hypothetical protein